MRARPFLCVSLVLATAALAEMATGQVREQTADQQVRHTLSRLAFGPRPGDYDKVRQMGVDVWIDQQLHPERVSDPAVSQLLTQLPTYTASIASLQKEYPRQNQQLLGRMQTRAESLAFRQQNQAGRRIITDVQAARVGRAVISERQLEEVLVDFWLNHFTVFLGKNAQEMRYYLASYEREVIRPRVFGNFRDMLGAVAKSPAMLHYLDNRISVADSNRVTVSSYGLQQNNARGRGVRVGRGNGNILPTRVATPPVPQRGARGLNENYARELLELHTLGVDGGYTQQDVIEVARALTGWSIVPPVQDGRGGGRANARLAAMASATTDGEFMFRPQVHDAEEKLVLGVMLRGGRGIEDGEQVLDIVAKHPSTAKYIATKLARRFVSDTPPASLVDRAAQTFTKTKGDLREVVRVIVTSPEFFSSAAYRSKVKSPFELVVSALRTVGAPADATPRTHSVLALLGQPVFGHQTPDGWPETGDEWINTGAILNRINFGTALAAGRVAGASEATWPLPLGVRRESRETQVDAVIAAFLGGEASVETRQIMISGTNPLLATAAADSGTNNQMTMRATNDMDVTGVDPAELRRAQAGRAFQNLPPLEGVAQIVGLALGSPEFQRR